MEEVDVYQSAIFETQHTMKETDPRPNKGYQAAAETPVKIDWPESSRPFASPQPTLSYTLLCGARAVPRTIVGLMGQRSQDKQLCGLPPAQC